MTAFAAPPEVVVSTRNSCLSMAPVEGDSSNALMYPGVPAVRARVVAQRYFAVGEMMTSSAQ